MSGGVGLGAKRGTYRNVPYPWNQRLILMHTYHSSSEFSIEADSNIDSSFAFKIAPQSPCRIGISRMKKVCPRPPYLLCDQQMGTPYQHDKITPSKLSRLRKFATKFDLDVLACATRWAYRHWPMRQRCLQALGFRQLNQAFIKAPFGNTLVRGGDWILQLQWQEDNRRSEMIRIYNLTID